MDKKQAIALAKAPGKKSSKYMRVTLGYHTYVFPFDIGQTFLKCMSEAQHVEIPYMSACTIKTNTLEVEARLMTQVAYEAMFLSQLLGIPHSEAITILENPDATDE